MPFTNHLSDSQSLLGQWIKQNLGNTRQLVTDTNKTLKGLPTISPPVGGNRAVLGTAIDIRIRYYLGEDKLQCPEALEGAILCTQLSSQDNQLVQADERDCTPRIMTASLVETFFNDLIEFVSETNPHHRLLDEDQEDRLNRFCISLAMLDGIYKGWVTSGLRRESFRPFEHVNTTEDILNLASRSMVEDIARLFRAFCGSFSFDRSNSIIVGPGFEGSDVVNGCEGDLIIDGTLIEIKTTAEAKIQGKWLRQLVCYYLMDLNDSYNISRLAVYLTRQSKLLHWDVSELIQVFTGNTQVDTFELRQDFRSAALREMSRSRHVNPSTAEMEVRHLGNARQASSANRSVIFRIIDWYRRWFKK